MADVAKGLVVMALLSGAAYGASLRGVHVVDRDYLMVRVVDGEVKHKDDGQGDNAFTSRGPHHDKVVKYDPGMDVNAAVQPASWTLSSDDDRDYGNGGRSPVACHRKTKVNGHAEQQWVGNDFHYEYTFEHTVFLKLPHSLKQGASYSLTIAPGVKTDKTTVALRYDIYESRTEALHANLVGFLPRTRSKAVDLYMWMGDGGARDYKAFEGNKVFLYDVASKRPREVGTVQFWKKQSDRDVHYHNLTRSDVWIADVAGDVAPGTYRVAVEGVGCTRDFEVRPDVYHDPYKASVKGFYYMRIGEKRRDDIRPVPRQPRYIPGKDPANTTVYLTTMHPWHPEWKTFGRGDKWDRPDAWKRFRKKGNPTNPNAYGGHSDAADWDRHLDHVSNIYDMLLPFILLGGGPTDDDLGIAESGNGIPDLLDEARNEVDFWLRLRDGDGYSHGLTNPNKKNELFQAAPTAMAAWANAANAAMLADCFRLAGNRSLMAHYRDEAVKAYRHAGGLRDQMLDKKHGTGNGSIRSRDHKMMAAAYLYNVTGEEKYEDAVKAESVCTRPDAVLDDGKNHNQVWATAGYLKTPRSVHYPDLRESMKVAMIQQAWDYETSECERRPSRRATVKYSGYFRTAQDVQATLVAHAIADGPQEKAFFLNALVLEADYGLGRNPMNMIHMTTATTELENKRSVQGAYTTGRNDGSPGVHPGQTPYMNLDDWGGNMTMGKPTRLHSKCYPPNFKKTWPRGEGYFNTRYVYAHNEFTPRQTMRGKMALYAYLYGLSKRR